MLDLSDQQMVLAGTLWGEARGFGIPAMEDVANVILNRLKHPSWMGRSIIQICLAPSQFSCWDIGNVNRKKILNVSFADQAFIDALNVADDAIAGRLLNLIGDANSYYRIGTDTPYWTATARHVVDHYPHSFWHVP